MRLILKILSIFVLCSNTYSQEMDLAAMIRPVPHQSRFSIDNYFVWCGSMVKGDDEKFYLFYSRWPKASKFEGWVTHSEIALAVADSPLGPYRHVKVILQKRNKRYWDADVTHNPTIHKFNNKYYLYYMGNRGNGEWWNHRNNQRIGVAVAKSPVGPWKQLNHPVIDTSIGGLDHLMTSNPSIVQMPDSRFLLIYKGVSEGKLPFGGKVSHGVAVSENPLGPFKKLPYQIFTKDSVQFAAEDPYLWYQNDKYWAIVKDMKGFFTNSGTSLALFESMDGLNWQLSRHALVSTTIIPWVDGEKKVDNLERPQLWLSNGVPKILFCAVRDGDMSYNVAIPLATQYP